MHHRDIFHIEKSKLYNLHLLYHHNIRLSIHILEYLSSYYLNILYNCLYRFRKFYNGRSKFHTFHLWPFIQNHCYNYTQVVIIYQHYINHIYWRQNGMFYIKASIFNKQHLFHHHNIQLHIHIFLIDYDMIQKHNSCSWKQSQHIQHIFYYKKGKMLIKGHMFC